MWMQYLFDFNHALSFNATTLELDFKKSLNKKWDIGTELRHYVVFDRKGGIQGNFQVISNSPRGLGFKFLAISTTLLS